MTTPLTPDDDIWPLSYLEDNIFNDLMNTDEYRKQIEEKFQRLRIPTVIIDIHYNHLSADTQNHIDKITCGRKEEESYKILNDIIPNVIARIAKQIRPQILAKATQEDEVIIDVAINSIRE
jgi:hypothetical protein